MTSTDAITVSDFVAAAKQQIEDSAEAVWVSGEVANFTCAASGHWYFTLRDGSAQLACVMLARQNRLVDATPTEGDSVAVFGAAALYAPRARFQLAARLLRFDGAGRLYQLFLQRKKTWHERGWFANARPLPPYPRTIGVVCSTAGAALHDVLRTLAQRDPSLRVILYPAPAQGADAAEKIGAMVTAASRRRECEALLVVRGGGGIEDLWAYNEEPVVKAIADCAVPVISGIGHETDETLADYAADLRCATPTAAATAAAPDAAALRQKLQTQCGTLAGILRDALDDAGQRLDWALKLLAAPRQLLMEKEQGLRERELRLKAATAARLAEAGQRLAALRLPAPQQLLTEKEQGLRQCELRLKAATAARLAEARQQLAALRLPVPRQLLMERKQRLRERKIRLRAAAAACIAYVQQQLVALRLPAPRQLLMEREQRLRERELRLKAATAARLADARQQLTLLHLPAPRLLPAIVALTTATQRLAAAGRVNIAAAESEFKRRETALELLSPQKLLQRGWSIVTNASGSIIRRKADFHDGEKIKVQVSDGSVQAMIDGREVT